MRRVARELTKLGSRYVLLKGGHLEGGESVDILDDGQTQREFRAERIATKNTHGTGCTLSAAIAALLPQSASVAEAVERAKNYLTEALRHADELSVGQGHGPVHHFAQLWGTRGAAM
jgi:hydroxymethylpyrimidine/phosphomethylpyrimidine kinase